VQCKINVALHQNTAYIPIVGDKRHDDENSGRAGPPPCPGAASAEDEDQPMNTAPKTKAKAPKEEVFAMNQIDVPAAVRETAEKSVQQAQEAFAKIKTAAEEATDAMEDTFESARAGLTTVNLKAIDAVQENTAAALDFAKKIISAKTVAEMVELQSAFLRDRFDVVSAQSKAMQEILGQVTTEALKPAKDVFEKGMKDIKVA